MQVWKTQVSNCMGGKRRYGKRKYKSAGVENVSAEMGRAILTQKWQKNKMQYTRTSKGSGYKYAIGSNVLANIACRNNKKYLKCDMYNARGYIEGDIFVEVKQHTQHQSMAEEIQRLQ